MAIADKDVSYRTELIDPDLEMVVRLRNHLAVVKGANQLMAAQWDELDDEDRGKLMDLALRGADLLNDAVTDFSGRLIDLRDS